MDRLDDLPPNPAGKIGEAAAPREVRPQLRLPSAGVPTPLLIAGVILCGLILFVALDAQRGATRARPTAPVAQANAFPPPPPLQTPPQHTPDPELVMPFPLPPPPPPPFPSAPAAMVQAPPIAYPMPPPAFEPPMNAPAQLGRLNEPAVVIDMTTGTAGASTSPPLPDERGSAAPLTGDVDGRTRSTTIRNQGAVIAQGSVIGAVLETAIDSTRPGPVRALVSRDARSFDGRNVLVPRGSRLIGEYRSDVSPGQTRALVVWTRLIRPDGVSMRLAAPASDQIGRGGVKGRVDSHFFQRFNGAILQSALDIGVNLASRSSSNSPVFVGVPGQLGGAMGQAMGSSQTVTPTIKVRQGVEVSVMVTRDLDFGGARSWP